MESKRRSADAEADEAQAPPLPEALEAALQRLAAALDRLRTTAERRPPVPTADTIPQDALAFLRDDDGARLAAERDAALVRADRLHAANAEALQRLERVETSIGTVMRELAERTADDTPVPDETS